MGFSVARNLNAWGWIWLLVPQSAQKGTEVLWVDGVVRGFQEIPPLVLCYLANVLLEGSSFQQLNGRVNWVIETARISLQWGAKLHWGKRTTLVPNITTGDVVSSGVIEDLSEEIFPGSRTLVEGPRKISFLSLLQIPPSLLCKSLYMKELSVVKARHDPWGRWLLGGNLRSVDRPIKQFHSGCCPIISCPRDLGAMVGIKVSEHRH